MDLPTTVAIVAFLSAVAGCLLLLSWVQHRQIAALAIWGLGSITTAISTSLIAARGEIADVWSIVIANALLAAAYGALWAGVRNFEGRTVSIAVTLAGALVWLMACTIQPIYATPSARATLLVVIRVTYLLLTVLELWRGRGEGLVSRWPLMALLAFHAVFLPIRAALWGPFHVMWMDNVDLPSLFAFELVLVITCAVYLFGSLGKERIAIWYRQASLRDPLTGIANRRAFLRYGARLLHRAQYAHEPVAFLFFDLDRFKAINDEFGHQAGDAVIATFCRVATARLRPGDLFARIGGEEFACLLPDTSKNDALLLAERVRAACEAASYGPEQPPQAVTVSVGVAMAGNATRDLMTLLAAADRALYRAKANGRNRVELADSVQTAAIMQAYPAISSR